VLVLVAAADDGCGLNCLCFEIVCALTDNDGGDRRRLTDCRCNDDKSLLLDELLE
jgi:hypothetical protein